MKRPEEIEKLSFEELEKIAGNESVKASDRLDGKVMEAVMAASFAEERRKEISSRYRKFAFSGAFAAIAAGLALVFFLPSGPKDTFEDPMEAYAQVEQTLAYISSKMDKGMKIAAEAEPALEMTNEIFENIKNR